MKIDRFLQLFVVKEKKFSPLYIEQAANIEAAAKLLVELLQEQDPEKQKALYKDIKEYEHSGDMITAKLYEELNKTFVTPIARILICWVAVWTRFLILFMMLQNEC